jgi:hypothetical protein
MATVAVGYSTHNYWKTLKSPNPTKSQKPKPSLESDQDMSVSTKMVQPDMAGVPARSRIGNFAGGLASNPDLGHYLHSGLVTDIQVHRHHFRDRNKTSEMSGTPFLPRNYLPAKERAMEVEKMHRAEHLTREPYNEVQKRNGIGRERWKNKELGHDMVFGDRTENERILKAVQFNALRDPIPPSDTHMLSLPSWKDDNKDAWVSLKPFKRHNQTYGLDKVKCVWNNVPLREDEKEDHHYIEGLEKLGDDFVSRKRDTKKEVDRKREFMSYSKPDYWGSTLHVSQSLRTKAMNDLLKTQPVFDNLSTNNHLDYYRDPLVETKNVDHIVPFKHSNNVRGSAMNRYNLSPTQKMYPNSAAHELGKHHEDANTTLSPSTPKAFPETKKNLKRLGTNTIVEEKELSRERDPLGRSEIGSASKRSFTGIPGLRRKDKDKVFTEEQKVDGLLLAYF